MTILDPLSRQRHLFDLPDEVHYLNVAYMSPLLRSSVEAGVAAVARKARPWEIAPEDFFGDADELRRLVARLLGADAEGVAIVPSASYGIATAAANLPAGPVVVLAEQFPSNVYTWRERGQVVTVARPADLDWTSPVLDAIADGTAVVTVPQCHWTDGSMLDLVAVGERCRQVGAALVVDATQSLGALPFDTARIRPDFVAVAGYKWLLGPYSVSYLWVAPAHRHGVALEGTWTGRAGAEDFAGLVDYRDRFAPGARRFDMGEMANFALLPVAIDGLCQLLDWGIDRVQATIAGHTARIEAGAVALGLSPVPAGRRVGHLIGIRFPGGVPSGLTERLAGAGVHVSVRGSAIRVSPHVFTTDADIDALLAVLAG